MRETRCRVQKWWKHDRHDERVGTRARGLTFFKREGGTGLKQSGKRLFVANDSTNMVIFWAQTIEKISNKSVFRDRITDIT